MNPFPIIVTQLHPIGPYKWCAFYEPEGLQGWGRTEQEAKEDLEDQIAEEMEEQKDQQPEL